MPRYQPGLLEQCVKDIIADALESGIQHADFRRRRATEEEEDKRTHDRGRVTDPESDRRLKQNRSKAA